MCDRKYIVHSGKNSKGFEYLLPLWKLPNPILDITYGTKYESNFIGYVSSSHFKEIIKPNLDNY